jgi:hypothetical protein
MALTQRQTYYGLVQQNGPFALTLKDQQRLKEKDPLWLGGGNPAGGRAHAGHANWLVTVGYPHRSDGFSAQAEILSYPKPKTDRAFKSLVDYQSDQHNQTNFNEGTFGIPPGGSPFLPSDKMLPSRGPMATLQIPGYTAVTGLAPGSMPDIQTTQATPSSQPPPLLTPTSTASSVEVDDIFNDFDPRPAQIDVGVQSDLALNQIDTGVVLSSSQDRKDAAVSATEAAVMETAQRSKGKGKELVAVMEQAKEIKIQLVKNVPPLTRNDQLDARTVTQTYANQATQVSPKRVQNTPTQTIIDLLVNTPISTQTLPVPSVVSNGIQTDALTGLVSGDRIGVTEMLVDRVQRLEQAAQTETPPRRIRYVQDVGTETVNPTLQSITIISNVFGAAMGQAAALANPTSTSLLDQRRNRPALTIEIPPPQPPTLPTPSPPTPSMAVKRKASTSPSTRQPRRLRLMGTAEHPSLKFANTLSYESRCTSKHFTRCTSRHFASRTTTTTCQCWWTNANTHYTYT